MIQFLLTIYRYGSDVDGLSTLMVKKQVVRLKSVERCFLLLLLLLQLQLMKNTAMTQTTYADGTQTRTVTSRRAEFARDTTTLEPLRVRSCVRRGHLRLSQSRALTGRNDW